MIRRTSESSGAGQSLLSRRDHTRVLRKDKQHNITLSMFISHNYVYTYINSVIA